MSRTVYVNGDWVDEADAKISIFDRAFLMADGIYEVTCVLDGKLVDYTGHVARLKRSVVELKLPFPLTDDELLDIHREIVARNKLKEGVVYLQVTRGVAERDFVYPPEGTPPSIVIFTQTKNILESPAASHGISVALVPDLRWGRRDIKTVQLLYPSMAKMQARERGADEAWLVQDGLVTEASSATAYIVSTEGVLVTRDLSHALLAGITRASVLNLAATHGVAIEERPFSAEEAKAAGEAFITSASSIVMPVVSIDGQNIGDGKPGKLTTELRKLYIETQRKSAI